MISTLLYVYYNFCTPGGVSDFTYANTSPLKKKIDYKPFPKRENFSSFQHAKHTWPAQSHNSIGLLISWIPDTTVLCFVKVKQNFVQWCGWHNYYN